MKRIASGFSLLEVLVALFLFALLGVTANRFLGVMIKTEEVAEHHSDDIKFQLRALEVIRRDFFQAVPRLSREPSGKTLSALLSSGDEYLVEFTRAGWLNPMENPRSELVRVAYRVGVLPETAKKNYPALAGDSRKYLLRYFWPYPDRHSDTPVAVQPIIADVESCEFKYLDSKGQWLSSWPPKNSATGSNSKPSTALPRAVQIHLRYESGIEVKRILLMSEYP